jgi:competence ComEA-like helix-hairpin-helix protein
MKQFFKSYTSFTRAERMGLILLSIILIVLIVIKATMHIWLRSRHDDLKDQQMMAAWEYVQKRNEQKTYLKVIDDAAIDNPVSSETININTADSAALVELKGIGPATAHRIMEYRRQGGRFSDLEAFRHLCRMPHKTLEKLRPHLRLN